METVRLKLIYPEEKIKEPLLSKVCKKFDIDINIRKANVQEKIGWLELEFVGSDEEIKKAMDFLKSNGIEVLFLEGHIFRE
ncbi:MAG: FeS-binding protein [Persephonella sp.]|nr:MAG: FeS-binding protein [Persephonella sp.]